MADRGQGDSSSENQDVSAELQRAKLVAEMNATVQASNIAHGRGRGRLSQGSVPGSLRQESQVPGEIRASQDVDVVAIQAPQQGGMGRAKSRASLAPSAAPSIPGSRLSLEASTAASGSSADRQAIRAQLASQGLMPGRALPEAAPQAEARPQPSPPREAVLPFATVESEAAPVDDVEAEPVDDVEAVPVDDVEAAPVDDVEAAPVDNVEAAPDDDVEVARIDVGAVRVDDVEAVRVDDVEAVRVDDVEAVRVDDVEAVRVGVEAVRVDDVEAVPIHDVEAAAAAFEEDVQNIDELVQQRTFRGVKGNAVKMMANFFRIKIDPGRGLFQYKVSFTPHLEDTHIRRKVVNELVQTLGKSKTFDGVKLFLPVPVQDGFNFSTCHPHDPTIELKVTLTALNVSTEDRTQFYNLLIRRVMLMLDYIEINRDFYNPKSTTFMKQHNLEIWPGYVTAIDVYEGGLMLCLNSVSRVLRRETILDMLKKAKSQYGNRYKNAFEGMVIGTSVITHYSRRHYRIDDVDWNQNPTNTFDQRGTPVSYKDYYLNQYGTKIFDMQQPLLVSRIKARKNDPRGETYFVSLVPELCNQSGLTDELRSNILLMRDLVAFSRSSPNQRYTALMDFLASVSACEDAQTLMTSWGMSLESQCVIDQGRVIPGPTLQFNIALTLKSAPADFTREATNNKCYMPVQLKRWQIYVTRQDREKADKLVQQYRQVAPILGINVGPNPDYVIVSNRSGQGIPSSVDYRQILQGNAYPVHVQFIVVIMPMAKDDLYAAVKKYCLTDVAMPSQVILSKTLAQDKKLRSVMQKVALQINCKLGGALWALSIPLKELIMFVGIDCHHDPSRKKKSVLALVASLDNPCTQYYSRIVHQTAHQESADAIRPVFIQALSAFFTVSHRYPNRIVVFRDGVGDGMLPTVKAQECAQLKKEALAICEANLKFFFVVVQKRINERLFLCKPARQLDNPVPGSVMDHTITRRGEYDFFLVSQLVRQGTVGPSHFVVLEDSGENKPDLIQRLSYVTTYMYYNWPGSVRVPAMCQYAHKLAMLVGQHLTTEPLREMDRQLYYL